MKEGKDKTIHKLQKEIIFLQSVIAKQHRKIENLEEELRQLSTVQKNNHKISASI